jgi:hypothetical protein
MNGVWIVAGLGVLAAIAAIVAWSQRRRRQTDLGIVSQQWVAEQRFSQKQDPR